MENIANPLRERDLLQRLGQLLQTELQTRHIHPFLNTLVHSMPNQAVLKWWERIVEASQCTAVVGQTNVLSVSAFPTRNTPPETYLSSYQLHHP